MKNFKYKKLKCFYTNEDIFRYYNISSQKELNEANDDFSWSKEHLISRNHELYKELSDQDKLKNIVDCARIVNSNLNDSPLYIKLIIKQKFSEMNTEKLTLEDIKKIFNKTTKEICKKYNFNRGISYKENSKYHTEIDKIVFNHHFNKDHYETNYNNIPQDILKLLKKEKYFIDNTLLSTVKCFKFKIWKYHFNIHIKW